MHIQLAQSEAELRACFPTMVQLRTHLTEAAFVAQVQLQARETGYQLVFARAQTDAQTESKDGAVQAVAGFIVRHMLSSGKTLYVDDLVTSADARSLGYGAALMAWLDDYARAAGCDTLSLDSGVQRFDAHRFYFRERMSIFAYHFRRSLRHDG